MNDAQKTAILEVMKGLYSAAIEAKSNPALNEGDYSVYYLMGIQLGHKVKERAESETMVPDHTKPRNDWMDGWVYAYNDPDKVWKEFGL